MNIMRSGSQPSTLAPEEHYTGVVRLDSPFEGEGAARILGRTVTFEPGARTDWHTHPLGQTLLITAGLGLVQHKGSPVEEVRPGDIVWISPGEKHWHGATATTAMSHVAIVEVLDGKASEWFEKVSDEEFNARI